MSVCLVSSICRPAALLAGMLLVSVFPVAAPAETSVSAEEAPPDWIDRGWGNRNYWHDPADGVAEVNEFDATTTLHGAPRGYRMMAIFSDTAVTADGSAEVSVQSKPLGEIRPALKMSIISEQVETGVYPCDYASTVLTAAENPARVFSSLTTSHDWQGITAKRYSGGGTAPVLEGWNTASPGALRRELPADVVPLEAVPLFLRAMDWSTTASFRCVPTLIAHRLPWSGLVPEPDILTLQAAVDGTETTTTAAGTFDCYRVRVFTPEGKVPMMLWFEREFPNRLIYKTTASGKIFSLRHSERRKLAPSDPR